MSIERNPMKVKCLSEFTKDSIIAVYNTKRYTLLQLADSWEVSPRTIGRILEERGLATPVPRLKGEAYQVMQLLKKHDMSAEALETLLDLVANRTDSMKTSLKQYVLRNTK